VTELIELPDHSDADLPSSEALAALVDSLAQQMVSLQQQLANRHPHATAVPGMRVVVGAEAKPAVDALLTSISAAAAKWKPSPSMSGWCVVDIDPTRCTTNGQLSGALIAATIEQARTRVPRQWISRIRRFLLGEREWGADLLEWLDESGWSPNMQSRFRDLLTELHASNEDLYTAVVIRNVGSCTDEEREITWATLAPLLEHERTLVVYGLVHKDSTVEFGAHPHLKLDISNPAPSDFREYLESELKNEMDLAANFDEATLRRWVRALNAVSYPLKSRAREVIYNYRRELERALGKGGYIGMESPEGVAPRVMFFALLTAGHRDFVETLRIRPEGADVYMRLQRMFQTPDMAAPSGEPGSLLTLDPWRQYAGDPNLRHLFRLCLGARVPLVRPFYSRRSACAYLWPGSSSKWRSMTDDSEKIRSIWSRVLRRTHIDLSTPLDKLVRETEEDAEEAREYDEYDLLIELGANILRYRERFPDVAGNRRLTNLARRLASEGQRTAQRAEDRMNEFRAHLVIVRTYVADGMLKEARDSADAAEKLTIDDADRLRVQEARAAIQSAALLAEPGNKELQQRASEGWSAVARMGEDLNDDASRYRSAVYGLVALLRGSGNLKNFQAAAKLEAAAREYEEVLDSIAEASAAKGNPTEPTLPLMFISYAGPTADVVNQVLECFQKRVEAGTAPLVDTFNYRRAGDIAAGGEWDVDLFNKLSSSRIVLAFVSRCYRDRFDCMFEARLARVRRTYGTHVLWVDVDGAGVLDEFFRIESLYKGKQLLEGNDTVAAESIVDAVTSELVAALKGIVGVRPQPQPRLPIFQQREPEDFQTTEFRGNDWRSGRDSNPRPPA
jgi:hypothetical protein